MQNICSLEWLYKLWPRVCFSHSLSLQRACSDNLNAESIREQGVGKAGLSTEMWCSQCHSFQPRLFKYQLLVVKPICQSLSYSLGEPYSHFSLPNYFHKTVVLSLHPDTSHFFPVLAWQSCPFWSGNARGTKEFLNHNFWVQQTQGPAHSAIL